MNQGFAGFLTRLREAVGADHLSAAPDADLLTRYLQDRDDAAFTELVRRHGPAVLAECWSTIGDPSITEDAFQAVFLVLARRAGEIRHPELLGGWLRGVAGRVAVRARRRAAKRAATEKPLAAAPEPAVHPVPPTADLRTVLDEELNRLPPEYREAVVVCDVDGLSRREAAKRLGIPDGTLSNRLTRARALLGRRLLRRGIALGAGLGTSQLAEAAIPDRLVALTVECAFRETIPPGIESLVSEGLNLMILPKKLLAPLIVATTLGTVVVGVVYLVQRVTPPTSPSATAATPVVTPTTRAVPPDPDKPRQPWPEPKFGEMIMASTFSTDRKLAAMAQDHRNSTKGFKVFVYDTATWKEVGALRVTELRDFIRGLSLTADGKRAFIGGDNIGVHVWDTDTDKLGKQLDTGPGKSMCRSLRLSPDGKMLAGNLVFVDGQKQGIRLWDAVSGEVVRTIPIPNDLSFDYPISFADNGGTIAGICNSDEGKGFRGVIEWDVKTGAEKRRLDVAAAVGPYKPPIKCIPPMQLVMQSLSYSDDAKLVVVGGGYMRHKSPDDGRTVVGCLWVIDRESGKMLKTLIEDRVDLARSAGFVADGKKLLVTLSIPSRTGNSKNTDDEFTEIQRWDTTTWELDWIKIVPRTERWKVLTETTK